MSEFMKALTTVGGSLALVVIVGVVIDHFLGHDAVLCCGTMMAIGILVLIAPVSSGGVGDGD